MTSQQPAYKEIWFWIVFSPLLVVAGVSVVMLRFAWVGADDRVYDDYYKVGRMINNRFLAEETAKRLGVNGTLSFELGRQAVVVNVTSEAPTDTLQVTLSHPAKAAKDQTLALAKVGPNAFLAPFSQTPEGHYYILLEGNLNTSSHWRVAAEINFNQRSAVDFGVPQAAGLLLNPKQ